MQNENALPIYIAGGSTERALVFDMVCRVRDAGGRITYDWTNDPGWGLGRPLTMAERAETSRRGLAAVAEARVFWLMLPAEKSEGAGTELGAALAFRTAGKPLVVVCSGPMPDARMFPAHADHYLQTHEEAFAFVLECIERGFAPGTHVSRRRFALDVLAVCHEAGTELEGAAIFMGAIADQIKEAGGPDGTLEEQLSTLLTSHKALAEVGEEMPSKEAFLAALWKTPGHPSVEGAEAAIEILRPIIARLQRERNELAARLDAGQFTVNVDIAEAKAKLEEVAAMAERYEATLDRALTKTQALASCSDPPSIGIGDPPPKPPPPPPSVADDDMFSSYSVAGLVELMGKARAEIARRTNTL